MLMSRNVRAFIFLPKTDPLIAWTTRRALFFQKGFEMYIPYFHRQGKKCRLCPRYRSGDEVKETPEKSHNYFC